MSGEAEISPTRRRRRLSPLLRESKYHICKGRSRLANSCLLRALRRELEWKMRSAGSTYTHPSNRRHGPLVDLTRISKQWRGKEEGKSSSSPQLSTPTRTVTIVEGRDGRTDRQTDRRTMGVSVIYDEPTFWTAGGRRGEERESWSGEERASDRDPSTHQSDGRRRTKRSRRSLASSLARSLAK